MYGGQIRVEVGGAGFESCRQRVNEIGYPMQQHVSELLEIARREARRAARVRVSSLCV